MGIFKEKTLPLWAGILVLILAFGALYQPWRLGTQELLRMEGLYAVQATEFDFSSATVTAHGAAIQNAYPLFPALASLAARWTMLPMDFVLRLISVMMVAAGAVVVYVASSSERPGRAGLVAAAMYISTNLMFEKGLEGYPATTSAFLLLLAQLLFFQFGFRRSNWNLGWIFSLGMMALGFCCGGFTLLCYFLFPLFFLRRPLSVKSKFRKPGFAIGVAILAGAVIAWWGPYWILSHRIPLQYIGWEESSFYNYLLDVLVFPVELPFRLLPWTIIAWIPFCVALQALDETPIFSRYLRTLVIAGGALLWFGPDRDPREIIYILGPLSILVGINYDLAMRRYGFKIRKLLILAEYFALATAAALGIFCLAPQSWLEPFFRLSLSLAFRDAGYHRIWAAVMAVLILLMAIYLRRIRQVRPIWLILLLTMVISALFYWTTIAPYRAQEQEKRLLGQRIGRVLSEEPVRPRVLYKDNIQDLYSELYYAHIPVQRLQDLGELPSEPEAVYLVGTEFPLVPDRDWSNLLPADFTYREQRLCLWKGVKRPRE